MIPNFHGTCTIGNSKRTFLSFSFLYFFAQFFLFFYLTFKEKIPNQENPGNK